MLLFLVLRADHSSAHRLALDLAVETGLLFVRVLLSKSFWGAASTVATTHKGQMRTTLCAAFATIAAALRTTHRRALLLSPASLYPLAARAEPLPSGRKELYALVCAAAWPFKSSRGGSLMTAMLPSY